MDRGRDVTQSLAAGNSVPVSGGTMLGAAESGAWHSHGQAITLAVMTSLPPCSSRPLLGSLAPDHPSGLISDIA